MTIYHQIYIEADSSVVYSAITKQELLSKWWIKDCEAEPILGHINVFRNEGYVDNHMKIIDLMENQKIRWLCTKGPEEWLGTEVIFKISKQNGYTKLDFKHVGWREQSEFFGICSFHWARHLMMLKDLCEKGINAFNQERELKEIKKVIK
jgi:uncharacterized protein YndB with AHSA1/START domain